MSCWVSITSRSAPPSTSAAACSLNVSESSAKDTPERAGSSLEGSMPLGPIAPATNRGRDGVANASAAARAMRAAHRLISRVCSPTSHSCMRIREAWKLLVSTTSQPASRYSVWMRSITSGRVIERWSLLPCWRSPPKSAAVRSAAWICVPIAPSKMTARRSIRSRYGWVATRGC